MAEIQIVVKISDQHLEAYEREAKRRDVSVESLVEQTANTLLQELEIEEEEGTDHPILPG